MRDTARPSLESAVGIAQSRHPQSHLRDCQRFVMFALVRFGNSVDGFNLCCSSTLWESGALNKCGRQTLRHAQLQIFSSFQRENHQRAHLTA
jgi:hypothetical protein